MFQELKLTIQPNILNLLAEELQFLFVMTVAMTFEKKARDSFQVSSTHTLERRVQTQRSAFALRVCTLEQPSFALSFENASETISLFHNASLQGFIFDAALQCSMVDAVILDAVILDVVILDAVILDVARQCLISRACFT